jgi:hypothetical protein
VAANPQPAIKEAATRPRTDVSMAIFLRLFFASSHLRPPRDPSLSGVIALDTIRLHTFAALHKAQSDISLRSGGAL